MKVRKRFLKPFAMFMAICMLVSLGGMTAANNDTEVEIIVPEDVSCEKAQLIKDTINGKVGISPFFIACIFGHSLAITDVRIITHRHWAVSPRCRQVTHRITYCTRSTCNHIASSIIISDLRIQCCP